MTNTKKFLIFVIAVSSLFLNGCFNMSRLDGSGHVVTEQRHVPPFSKVELTGIGTVNIRQGEDPSVRVSTDDNIISYVETRVSSGELVIEVDYFGSVSPTELTVDIVTPYVSRLCISGSGDIRVNKEINVVSLELDINGSGSITAVVDAERVNSDISGSGDIKLYGTTDHHRVEIDGSGDVHAFPLTAQSTNVDISGSGNVEVTVDYSLDVDINGSGDVYYKGSPTVSTHINGSGSVHNHN